MGSFVTKLSNNSDDNINEIVKLDYKGKMIVPWVTYLIK